jgi:4-amino-4-deoxy-L-arabinose transferase-like glycosyltransferase
MAKKSSTSKPKLKNMFSNLLTKFKNNTEYFLPITLVLILGFILRIYRLTDSPIWRDEAFSWSTIHFGFDQIFNITKWDTHPPAFSYLLFFWTRIFGETPFGLRTFSLLFGMIAIFLIYKFVFQQTKSYWIASLTSLLVAVNPELVMYSQEARSYSAFLAITAGLFYILGAKLNTKRVILGALLGLFALYTHSLYIVVVPLIFLWNWFFYGKNNLKHILTLFGLIIIGYLPYLSVLRQQTKDKGGDFWLKFDPFNALQDNLPGFFTSYLYHSNYQWTPILLSAIFSTALIGLLLGIYQEYKNNRIRLIIIPIIFIAVTYFISFISPVFYIRYIQFVIPFVLLIMVIGYHRIFVSNKLVSILIVLIFTISSILLYFTDIKRTPINAQYNLALLSLKAQNVQNIVNPNPDITFDVVAYYNYLNQYQFNNYVLQYPQLTKKQFQKGIIKDDQYLKDPMKIKSFVVLTEWENQDAKAYLNGLSMCLDKTTTIDSIIIDFYSECQI